MTRENAKYGTHLPDRKALSTSPRSPGDSPELCIATPFRRSLASCGSCAPSAALVRYCTTTWCREGYRDVRCVHLRKAQLIVDRTPGSVSDASVQGPSRVPSG